MPEDRITQADIERLQRGFMHPLDWTINGDKVKVHVRMHAEGATSGLELDIVGWQVWTVRDGLVARMQAFGDEAEAREAVGLGQNASP